MAYGYSGGSLGGGRLNGGGVASNDPRDTKKSKPGLSRNPFDTQRSKTGSSGVAGNDPRDRQSGASRTARGSGIRTGGSSGVAGNNPRDSQGGAPRTVRSRKPFNQIDVNQQRTDGRLGVRQANRPIQIRARRSFAGGPFAGGTIGSPRTGLRGEEEDEGFLDGLFGEALDIINPQLSAALDETRPTQERVGAGIATVVQQIGTLTPPIALVRGIGGLFNWMGAEPMYPDGTVRNPEEYAIDSGPGTPDAPQPVRPVRPVRPREQEIAPMAVAARPARRGARSVFNLTTARIRRPLFFGIG